jgi:diguanylate cyclase (GGDEF)-like protein
MRLVEAERAWAVGEPWTAAAAYDSALHDVQDRQRPWHRALISERAAAFHLTHGMAHVGRALLREAREAYRAWGATAKVRRLDDLYPGLRAARAVAAVDRMGSVDTGRSSNLSNTAIDLLGVLSASQALSSETSLDRLHSRVVEVLGAMTGATAVRLLLRDDTGTWYLPGDGGDRVRLDDPRAAGSVPLSVLRYVTRVQEPLTVADAARDDRFRRDPYLSAVDTCALLAVPVITHGTVRALLLLENRLSRGAFTADRLGAVTLVAGQLAVSLDNAMVYSSLERLVAERTEALAAANERLELLAVTDPLTGLANRRRLADLLDAEWSRALRSKNSLAVAMIDIDHFKRYNDGYGHAAGDQCLRQVAQTMSGNVRDTDHLARYGGEEFTILLPETDLVHAAAVANRVRAAVATLALPHTTTPAKIVTVSIGVAAAVPSPDDTADRLIHAADTHLYAAKRAGRNRVATEPEPAE